MATSPRKYYTLITRAEGSKWVIELGSFDREDVVGEQEEMTERPKGSHGYVPKKHTKIITTGSRQREIDAAVDKLNAGLKGSE